MNNEVPITETLANYVHPVINRDTKDNVQCQSVSYNGGLFTVNIFSFLIRLRSTTNK